MREQNDACTYIDSINQLPTIMPSNRARINIDLIQSTQYQALISSDLPPKIRSVHKVTVNLKAVYSSVRALNSARLIG